MVELIAAINTVLATYKTVKELYEKADYMGLKSHILSMNEQILNMKEAALGFRDENVNLKEEIKKYKEIEDRGMVMRGKAYYDKNNIGPYCPTCFDNEKYLSLLCAQLSFPPACPKCHYSLDQ